MWSDAASSDAGSVADVPAPADTSTTADTGVDVLVVDAGLPAMDTGVDAGAPSDALPDVSTAEAGQLADIAVGVDAGACSAGLTACGDAGCVDTQTDPKTTNSRESR